MTPRAERTLTSILRGTIVLAVCSLGFNVWAIGQMLAPIAEKLATGTIVSLIHVVVLTLLALIYYDVKS